MRCVGVQAELGAPAGLAYDLSFNKFGMRVCFLGISQNLPSYARRFSRRLAQHHKDLLDGVEVLDPSVTETALYGMRGAGLSPLRKREIERILKGTTVYEAATEVGIQPVNYGMCLTCTNAIVPGSPFIFFCYRRSHFSNRAEEAVPFHRVIFFQLRYLRCSMI